MTVILNGKASNTKPEDIIAVNGKRAIELPSTLNGFAPTDIAINGYNHPPVLPGCVLYLPLWHSKLSRQSPIYSMDKNEFACSVTGALWTPQGRTFDGLDNKINLNAIIPEVSSDTQGTIIAWIYVTAAPVTSEDYVFTISDASGLTYQTFHLRTDGTIASTHRGLGATKWANKVDTALSLSAWHCVGVTQNATAPVLYVEGIAVAQTFLVEVDKTVWLNGMSDLDTGRLGSLSYNNLGDGFYWLGNVGGFWYFNRALSGYEMLHVCNATKWRYK